MATVCSSAVVSKAEPPRALSPLEWHAVSKAAAGEAEKLRDELAVGRDQKVDLAVRIFGHIDVAAGTNTTQTRQPDVADLLAVVLSALTGPAQRKIKNRLREVFTDRAAHQLEPGLMEEAEKLVAALSSRTVKPKRGNVTGALVVDLLERDGQAIPDPKRKQCKRA